MVLRGSGKILIVNCTIVENILKVSSDDITALRWKYWDFTLMEGTGIRKKVRKAWGSMVWSRKAWIVVDISRLVEW